MDAVSALQPASAIQSIPFLFIYFRTLLRNGALLSLFFSCTSGTLPAIQGEFEPAEPQIIFDLPRPKRDDISPERAMVNRWAERCTRAATPVEPDGYTSIPGNSK